jgi:hypothetical protein
MAGWYAIQRSEYNKDEVVFRGYDFEAAPSGSQVIDLRREYNIAQSRLTPKASDVIDIVRGASLTIDPAISKVTSIYKGGALGNLILNGIFQNWSVVGDEFLPDFWTANFLNVVERYPQSLQGDYSALIKNLINATDPINRLQQSGEATVAASPTRFLRISLGASMAVEDGYFLTDTKIKRSYWSLQVGTNHLQANGTWGGTPTLIEFRQGQFPEGVLQSWSVHNMDTAVLGGIDGNVQLRLYELTFELGDVDANHIEGILWDRISIDVIDENETEDIITIVKDIDSVRDVPKNLGITHFGDGPTSESQGAIKVGDDITTQWTRRGESDNTSIERLNNLVVLRALSLPNKIIRGDFIMDSFIINSFVIFNNMFIINGGEFDVRWSKWIVEMQQVLDNEVNHIFLSEQIEVKPVEDAASVIKYAARDQLPTVGAVRDYVNEIFKV